MRAGKRAVWGVWLLVAVGCMATREIVTLPTDDSLVRDQLVIYSDFDLPRHHRLVEDLVARRHDVADRLQLPVSDEPIHIYLFDSADRYHRFMSREYPAFPYRRAFFVESDTRLTVYAYWGDRVAEDLRHEVTHGYLHTMVPGLPLWLDEGLAEYFEVPRGTRGINTAHVELLLQAIGQRAWAPDLARLEAIHDPSEMTQEHYAEAWAWVHWMLETAPPRLNLLREHLATTRTAGTAPPLSLPLHQAEPLSHHALTEHLLALHRALREHAR